MEIFTLLQAIEDLLEQSKTIPFSGKAVVEKEEVLDIIKEIRLKLPDELKQAKWIKEERDRIINEAKKDADEIVNDATSRTISMIDEHEITKKAYEKKEEIIAAGNDEFRKIQKEADKYSYDKLDELEKTLTDLQSQVSQIESKIQSEIEVLKNGKKSIDLE